MPVFVGADVDCEGAGDTESCCCCIDGDGLAASSFDSASTLSSLKWLMSFEFPLTRAFCWDGERPSLLIESLLPFFLGVPCIGSNPSRLER